MDEDKNVEVKSSMLWNKRNNKCSENDYLALEIVRSIAAFMNSDGGSVIVGINPEKEIIGIEADFQCLGKQKNWDGWQQRLQDKIKKFSSDYVLFLDSIKVTKCQSKSKIVAQILVSQGRKPAFTKSIDNSQVDFYIRGINGIVPLYADGLADYLRSHWPRQID